MHWAQLAVIVATPIAAAMAARRPARRMPPAQALPHPAPRAALALDAPSLVNVKIPSLRPLNFFRFCRPLLLGAHCAG